MDKEGHPPHLESTNPKECYAQLKTQQCRDWKVGKCERGDQCLFGHDKGSVGMGEIKFQPALFTGGEKPLPPFIMALDRCVSVNLI